MREFDVIVIGAGQSGLTVGRYLKDKSYSFLILDQDLYIGEVWRGRPDNMLLFTSRQFCSLPGLNFPGEPKTYPTKDEVADYLELYATHHQLPVEMGRKVISVEKDVQGYDVKLENGEQLFAKAIVNATGSNQLSTVPKIARKLGKQVQQLTAGEYKNASQIEQPNVLVVGDGASGRQIAAELAATHKVTLSIGSGRKLIPNNIFGKDVFWWLSKTGIIFAPEETLIGRLLKKRNPVPCANLSNKILKKMGVSIKSRVIDCQGDAVSFVDKSRSQFNAVIWSIGYHNDTSWLKIQECIDGNDFVESKGITPEPGLFVVGRKWLNSRSSELILGIERDVNLVMPKLEQYLTVSKSRERVSDKQRVVS